MPYNIAEVLEFFSKCSTQWEVGFAKRTGLNYSSVCSTQRKVGFAGRTGLNYSSVEMLSKIYEFTLTPFRMMIIQEIEKFYLEIYKE